MKAFIALGSNIGDSYQIFRQALELLRQRVGPLLSFSRVYDTAPLVPPGKNPSEVPPYLNAVLAIESSMPPSELLDTLLDIERQLGRDRALESERWMSRVLDLDILAVQDLVIEGENLRLPHPEMHRRDFVLIPFSEIAADWKHPVRMKTVSEMLQELLQAG